MNCFSGSQSPRPPYVRRVVPPRYQKQRDRRKLDRRRGAPLSVIDSIRRQIDRILSGITNSLGFDPESSSFRSALTTLKAVPNREAQGCPNIGKL